MSGGSTTTELDALTAVLQAVSIVCEVDLADLSAATRFEDLGADSLSRVSIADVVEAEIAGRTGRRPHIDDALLGRMSTLADLAADLEG
jgi:Phosphopantetheine attachment site